MGDISLRLWLDKPERSVNIFECLHIFREIIEIIHAAHSQGIVHNVRPSYFVMRSFNHVWLIESTTCSHSGSDTLEESDFINAPRDDIEKCEAAVKIGKGIDDQELLLEFLSIIQQKKREASEKLQQTISFLCSDIEEATKQKTVFKEMTSTELGSDDCSTSSFPSITVIENEDSACLGTRKRVRTIPCVDDTEGCERDSNMGDDKKNDMSILSKTPRFLNNLKKLVSAYFLTRCKSSYSSGKLVVQDSSIDTTNERGSVVAAERSCAKIVALKEKKFREDKSPWTNPFLDGLCKYLSFNKFKVKVDLKQGDLLQSSNLVCLLSFDRDAEFFATAGVNKKIKVFECNTTIYEDRDIHYPVVEMVSQSTLSSTCWNTYFKSQIASSNFEGVVEGVSVGTIKTKSNVCCVRFPLDFAHFLAFRSADHQIYYYDLRNLKGPLV
ncbi:hypothetical protein JHK86_016371 [Glycine max]|nr:hypothetical protein JHK86_016371 [Glycine max]